MSRLRAQPPPASTLLAEPVPIPSAGDFVHGPSEFFFPTGRASFQRVALLQYDTAGLHVSGGYNGGSANCPVVVTQYVFPAPRMTFIGADPAVVRSLEEQWLSSAYDRSKDEIIRQHPDAVLQAEDAKIQDGMPAKKAVFRIDGNVSELFIFLKDRRWFVKYRHTYPEACASDARAALAGFYGVDRPDQATGRNGS